MTANRTHLDTVPALNLWPNLCGVLVAFCLSLISTTHFFIEHNPLWYVTSIGNALIAYIAYRIARTIYAARKPANTSTKA